LKIRILCVGKLASAPLKALAADYLKRLERLADVEVVELKDAEASDGAARLSKEAEKLRAEAGSLAECLLLDERGEEMDSVGFAKYLEKLEGASRKRLTLVLGSSHGIDPGLKAEVPKKLALSRMTLTHEWARVLLLEQVYRACCIRRKIPYHH
jgi:23S rRNA (pseudouridine1915-N3)-methyltransferase